MGIRDDSKFLEYERTRARLAENGQRAFAASDPLKRAYYEGSIAGHDGVSAIHNPYPKEPLRYKWFEGYTYGKNLRLASTQ